jgi:HAD superfamily hydrolase (TIGR01484 family)
MAQHSALLASDMDGTVIPLEEGPQREVEVAEFRDAVQGAPELLLAYVTGRGIALAEKGIRQFNLPLPHFQVCDVGTSLFRREGDTFVPDPDYIAQMRSAMDGLDFKDVAEDLKPIEHLLLQPWERQTEFKLSYHLPQGEDPSEIVADVRERLVELGAQVQAVYSVGAPSGIGLLDLLPKGAAKDSALHYLRDITGMDPEGVVYAGDSGNDLAPLLAGYKGIVVANAGGDLKEELEARMRDGGLPSEIHFSPYPYAKGVLDGARHFGIL